LKNYPLDQTVKEWIEGKASFDIKIRKAEIREQTNYPFNIIVQPGKKWKVKFMADRALFDTQTLERIAGHIRQILKSVVQNPEMKVTEIDILTPEEREEILYRFNDTATDYPKGKTVHELFEEQVEKTPDKTALVYAGKEISYGELNKKTNQLARFLRRKGLKPDGIVAILVERSLEMVIGILGILKAGGAYLPIDPDYPEERIKYMLEDSNAGISFNSKAVCR